MADIMEQIGDAAEDFAKRLADIVEVREVTYQIAFEDGDQMRLASGSTEEAPEALRHAMLTEALKNRG